MTAADVFAVIMAGGSGTRFWPASRRERPKQFLPIASDQPLIVETWNRLDGLVPPQQRLVVTAADQVELVLAALPELGADNLIVEPIGRNTGPCIALASAAIAGRSPSAVQVILPSDHVIRPAEAFRNTLAAAAEEALASKSLVTLGIRPTHPATGFGYIDAAEAIGERRGIRVHRVARFVEKPKRERAIEFLAAGSFFWNSGLFAWRTDVIEDAIERHMPAVREALRAPGRVDELYRKLDPIAIDVAVLEKARDVRMLPIDYFWSDVGSWDALESVRELDGDGHVRAGAGDVIAIDSKGCIVFAEAGHLTALVGVEDLVVVHARKATLVCPKSRAQDVKRIVDRLAQDAPWFQ